ncbi:uncharacterized protein LOC143040319 [Oratosquilla oratoria]|uniref:uncharacterized protein LOC143040319 n=1 Tax=Oratosquilla oratoria TaxID=337810 RepID=UPI003F75A157
MKTSWNVWLILLISSALTGDGLTAKKLRKDAEDSSMSSILVDIRNYLEHLPSVTALSERLSVLESLTQLSKEKTDAVEKVLGVRGSELVQLGERTKFLEDRIGADGDWRLDMAAKVARMQSALEEEESDDDEKNVMQTKGLKDLEERIKALEEKSVSRNMKLMALEQKIKDKDEELGVLRSEMATAQARMRILEERENNTEEVLKSVKGVVSALKAWHEVHQSSQGPGSSNGVAAFVKEKLPDTCYDVSGSFTGEDKKKFLTSFCLQQQLPWQIRNLDVTPSATSARINFDKHRENYEYVVAIKSVDDGECSKLPEFETRTLTIDSPPFTLSDLSPHRKYRVCIAPIIYGKREEEKCIDFVTLSMFPANSLEPPTCTHDRGDSYLCSVTVNGDCSQYRGDGLGLSMKIQGLRECDGKIWAKEVDGQPGRDGEFVASFQDIRSAVTYEVVARLWNEVGTGRSSQSSFTTDEFRPSTPAITEAISINKTAMLIKWNDPCPSNGHILHYDIRYRRKSSRVYHQAHKVAVNCENDKDFDRCHILKELEQRIEYVVQIRAYNKYVSHWSEEYSHVIRDKTEVCPMPYEKVGEECLLLGTTSASWAKARTVCKRAAQEVGGVGDLATPTKLEGFRNYVSNLSVGNTFLWVGGSDAETEGVWRWVTGELVDSEEFPWGNAEPDHSKRQNYMCVNAGPTVTFHDCHNSRKLSFICQLY